jgi:hypothetical protein
MVGAKDFILLAARDDPTARGLPPPPRDGTPRRERQFVFMDLGASVFNDGLGGDSQQYLYERYKGAGLEMDRSEC